MARVNTNRMYGKKNTNTVSKKPQANPSVSIVKAQEKKPSVPVKAQRQTGARIITKSVPVQNKSFPAVLVLFALICTSMVMLMVFNYAKRYEASVVLSNQERELERLKTELTALEAQNDTAISSFELQSYSTDELGYVSEEQLPYRVISIERQDRIISSAEDEQKGGFEILLSTIKALFE